VEKKTLFKKLKRLKDKEMKKFRERGEHYFFGEAVII